MSRLFAAPLLALLIALAACADRVPLSTGGDVEGYDALVAQYAGDPEAAAEP